ncbi:MAG: Na(+)/H(+) antiporter subunit B [Bacteroidales bacterium]|nr:Na(+)/H(+) antiporter subunit B [Bacteroidales bacterium]
MMKRFFIFLILAIVGYYIVDVVSQIPFGENRVNVGDYYLDKSPSELKVSNTVTAIVVNYRGFDTLGEVTVLFLAATGLASIMFRRKRKGEKDIRAKKASSRIIQIGSQILFPIIILLGAYVFIHGHLSPGGGFQGGVIIATASLLMLISYRKFKVNHSTISWIESIAGIVFVLLGVTGLILGKTFLENFLPTGELNNLLSGGIIGIIYVAVGFKVAAELTGLIDTLLLNNRPEANKEK